MNGYEIIRPRLHPDFKLPSRRRLLKLKVGDSVKLMFKVGDDDVERMWLSLTDTDSDDTWNGVVDNDALQGATAKALPVGMNVAFHPLDIIAIY